MHKLLIILSFLCLLTACSEEPVFYSKWYSFEENSWDLEYKPKFVVDIKDTTKAYDLVLTFRNTTDFPYRNLWVFLISETPTGERAREPYQVKISDDNGWVGHKTGSIVETSLIFSNRIFPTRGKYKFSVELGITESKVDEIVDLGMTVHKHDKDVQ